MKPSENKDKLAQALEKLTYLMKDRAANKALSNKLITEWKQSTLKETGHNLEDIGMIHSLNGMVHVLLGFQNHASQFFSEIQKINKVQGVHLGRENLPEFHSYYSDFAPIRCIRKACDLLRPMGNERCGI